MRELVLTRHNQLVDPLVHVWGWEIAVYLFLGGLVAGMMILAGYSFLKGRHTIDSCVCSVLPGAGLVLLSLGMLALFLDLEHKFSVWRLYVTFKLASPMSWGAWILAAVYPALLASALVRLPPWARARWDRLDRLAQQVASSRRSVVTIGAVNMALGIMLGIYTGILLSALGARPFWSSAALGVLFLFSGLSSSAALVHMIASRVDERELLARADNVFLSVELVVLGLFLIGLVTSTQAHLDAARLVLGGPFTAVFWVLVVGLGIAIPLILQVLAVSHVTRHNAVVPGLVLTGGLILRFVIVYAGQYSHWQ
jgi:formate-dependent nitrite reductase membrane component NrfD